MEAQVTITYRGPAGLQRAVLAAGLAGGILASQLLPGYPLEWRALLPLAVLGLGCWSTVAAYLATVAVLAFPIGQFSPYLMVLFIAVTVIPHRWILEHLPLALLVAWSPVLAALHVDLAIPILVGLFAGSRYGALAGALLAAWLKTYASMSGTPLDLLLLTGNPGSPAAVAGRFAGAGSLETLQLIGAPFAPNSAELLGNLLQIAAFAAAGATAGALAARGRAHLVLADLDEAPPAPVRVARRFLWTGLLPIGVALGALSVVLLLIPVAVGHPLSDLGLQQALDGLATRLLAGGAVALIAAGIVVAMQPLPPGARRVPAPPRPVPQPVAAPPPRPAPPAAPARAAAPPPVLPPVDLEPVKSGRFVPGWAAAAGFAAPLPAAEAPDSASDAADASTDSPPGPPARDIAIELD